jgi:hypothetical protein
VIGIAIRPTITPKPGETAEAVRYVTLAIILVFTKIVSRRQSLLSVRNIKAVIVVTIYINIKTIFCWAVDKTKGEILKNANKIYENDNPNKPIENRLVYEFSPTFIK